MQCPNDATTLVMSERSGIEIDYCPECRGIWLDRGELDKLIERSAEQSPAQGQPPQQQPQQWEQPGPAGSSGGLGAAAERLMGEVRRRGQGRDDDRRDGRSDDRRDPRYDDRRDPRDDDRRDPRYDGRRRNGGWLGDILG